MIGVLKRNEVVAGIGSAALVLLGAQASYFLTNRRLRLHYEAISEQEIAEAKLYYSRWYKTGEFADPENLITVEEQARVVGVSEGLIAGLGYREGEEEPLTADERIAVLEFLRDKRDSEAVELTEDERETVRDAVEDVVEDIFEKGVEIRAKEIPPPLGPKPAYVISNEEFYRNEMDFNQVTVAYYAEDGVLADERDAPINDVEKTIGEANLELFGTRSKDPNVVYIRNEALNTEFEVQRSSGSYENEVAGFRHSSTPLRMRRGDHE